MKTDDESQQVEEHNFTKKQKAFFHKKIGHNFNTALKNFMEEIKSFKIG